jgi:hypothetical protein
MIQEIKVIGDGIQSKNKENNLNKHGGVPKGIQDGK